MVACGTFSELQSSGLDFISLLKEEEDKEEARQGTTSIPGTLSHCARSLRDNSKSSLSSLSTSQYSLIEGAEPLEVVGISDFTVIGKKPLFPSCLSIQLSYCWEEILVVQLSCH